MRKEYTMDEQKRDILRHREIDILAIIIIIIVIVIVIIIIINIIINQEQNCI